MNIMEIKILRNHSLHLKIKNVWIGFFPLALIGYRDHWAKYHFMKFNRFFQFDFGPLCIEYNGRLDN